MCSLKGIWAYLPKATCTEQIWCDMPRCAYEYSVFWSLGAETGGATCGQKRASLTS